MMEGLLPWILGGLATAVVLAGLLALAVKRFGRQLATAQESALFRRLSDAHGLSTEERRALSAMALVLGLPDPAACFILPSTLSRGIERLRVQAPSLAKAAARLPERLFGPAPRG